MLLHDDYLDVAGSLQELCPVIVGSNHIVVGSNHIAAGMMELLVAAGMKR